MPVLNGTKLCAQILYYIAYILFTISENLWGKLVTYWHTFTIDGFLVRTFPVLNNAESPVGNQYQCSKSTLSCQWVVWWSTTDGSTKTSASHSAIRLWCLTSTRLLIQEVFTNLTVSDHSSCFGARGQKLGICPTDIVMIIAWLSVEIKLSM